MNDGFWQLLRAEWTKLRSVRRWVIGLFTVVLVTMLFSLIGAAGSSTDINQHPEMLGPVGPEGDRVQDQLYLVHQPLAGDGSITARVASQANSHERAKAGVMMRESTQPGSRYAAVLVTPGEGVRFHANYTTDRPGGTGAAPRWLRLTRTGSTITGYESADGTDWSEVGTVELEGLPDAIEVGVFVNSPNQIRTERSVGGTGVGGVPTVGTARFDNVRVEPPSPGASWRSLDLWNRMGEPGSSTERDGAFTLTGSGDIGPDWGESDIAQLSLTGIFAGQIAVIAVAVLFITAEFKRGMIRTTFAASPRRGRVLAAKAMVIGTVTFALGVLASVVTFLIARPVLRGNGFGPPAYELPSLTDGPVLRAIAGAALFLTMVALLGLGVGTILRRSAGAIAGLIVLLVVPFIIQGGFPLTVAQWLIRSTPIAGMSVLQTTEPDPYLPVTDPMNMATPVAGLAVAAGWAAAALALAYWRIRRRDA
jgi:ABC-type transport system involved in multi-copper enzyme maturation permease subunit